MFMLIRNVVCNCFKRRRRENSAAVPQRQLAETANGIQGSRVVGQSTPGQRSPNTIDTLEIELLYVFISRILSCEWR